MDKVQDYSYKYLEIEYVSWRLKMLVAKDLG